jgi:hypothetical protein
VYCAELIAQYRPPGGRLLAIEGLEAAASESCNRQRRDALQELVFLHQYKSGFAWDKELNGLGYWVRGATRASSNCHQRQHADAPRFWGDLW